jgi:hypothetical protein
MYMYQFHNHPVPNLRILISFVEIYAFQHVYSYFILSLTHSLAGKFVVNMFMKLTMANVIGSVIFFCVQQVDKSVCKL